MARKKSITPATTTRKKSAGMNLAAHTHTAATRPNNPPRELAPFVDEKDERVEYDRQPVTEPVLNEIGERNPAHDPQLVWINKGLGGKLTVPAVPIYTQEKIHPLAIIEDIRRRAGADLPANNLFADFNGLDDFGKKLEFYQHPLHWTNRFILGDSLLVMASLEFPEIVISDAHADPAFAAVVREAVAEFDFRSLPQFDQDVYRRMRREGIGRAMYELRSAMAEVRATQPEHLAGQLADLVWQMRTGEIILREMSDADRVRYFPLNDFRVLFRHKRVVIQCVSLVQVKTSRGRAYHSRFRPTVEFGGKNYVVCFSPSVIGKLHRRLKGGRMTYAALGDVYGFFEHCRHFEPCRIRGDGERRNELFEAVSFFDDSESERFWNHRYVKEVLGKNYDPAEGTPYHRVGYCPVALDGEYAVATSFLLPGFCKTPEYDVLMRANLPWAEKERLRALATDDTALVRLMADSDFSAVRLFHEGGVPQVVQSHEEWFVPYGA